MRRAIDRGWRKVETVRELAVSGSVARELLGKWAERTMHPSNIRARVTGQFCRSAAGPTSTATALPSPAHNGIAAHAEIALTANEERQIARGRPAAPQRCKVHARNDANPTPGPASSTHFRDSQAPRGDTWLPFACASAGETRDQFEPSPTQHRGRSLTAHPRNHGKELFRFYRASTPWRRIRPRLLRARRVSRELWQSGHGRGRRARKWLGHERRRSHRRWLGRPVERRSGHQW